MKGARKMHKKRAGSKRKQFRDLTPEDIAQLPANATGKGPGDHEAVARFELMRQDLLFLWEKQDVPPHKLIDALEEYYQELEKLLHRDQSGLSSISRFIPPGDRQRIIEAVYLFVGFYGDTMIEYAARKLAELEALFSKNNGLELTDKLMLSTITRFIQRAQGTFEPSDSDVSLAEWKCYEFDMKSQSLSSMLPQLAERARLLTYGAPDIEPLSDGPFSDDASAPASRAVESLHDHDYNEEADLLSNQKTDAAIQSDTSVTTDSDDENERVPILKGRNWLSCYDYVYSPFAENRPFEHATSRLIHRDLKMPGIHSDGLHVEDLVNIPPIHLRKPGTYNPLFERRIPLGPYEVAKSLLSWLGMSIYGGNAVQIQPLPGVQIIPRNIARHKKHYRHGRSGVVKPSKKQVFRLLGGNPKADRDAGSPKSQDVPGPAVLNQEEAKTSSRAELAKSAGNPREPVVIPDKNNNLTSERNTMSFAGFKSNAHNYQTLSQHSSAIDHTHQSATGAQNQASFLNSPSAGLLGSQPQLLPSPPRDPSLTRTTSLPSVPKHSPSGQKFPRIGLCHPCPIYFGHVHHICTGQECDPQNHKSLAQIPDVSRGTLPNNARPDSVLPIGSVMLHPDGTRESLHRRRYADLFWQRPDTQFQINDVWYQLRTGDHGTLWINEIEDPNHPGNSNSTPDSNEMEKGHTENPEPQKDQEAPKSPTIEQQNQIRDAAVQQLLLKFQQDIKRHERSQTTSRPLPPGNDIENEARLLNVQISTLSSLVPAGFPNHFDNFYPGRGFQENLDSARLMLTRYRSVDRVLSSSDEAKNPETLRKHTARLAFILRHVDHRSRPDLIPGDYADENDILQTPYYRMTPRSGFERLTRRLQRLSHLTTILDKNAVQGLDADKKVIRHAEAFLKIDEVKTGELIKFLVRTGDIIHRWEREELRTIDSGDRNGYFDAFEGYEEADWTKYFNYHRDFRRKLKDYRPIYAVKTAAYVHSRLKVLVRRFEAIESIARLSSSNQFEVDAPEYRQFEQALSLAASAYHHALAFQLAMKTDKEVCTENIGYVVGFEDAVLYVESCAAKCINPEEWRQGYVDVFGGLCVSDWDRNWEDLEDGVTTNATNDGPILGSETPTVAEPPNGPVATTPAATDLASGPSTSQDHIPGTSASDGPVPLDPTTKAAGEAEPEGETVTKEVQKTAGKKRPHEEVVTSPTNDQENMSAESRLPKKAKSSDKKAAKNNAKDVTDAESSSGTETRPVPDAPTPDTVEANSDSQGASTSSAQPSSSTQSTRARRPRDRKPPARYGYDTKKK